MPLHFKPMIFRCSKQAMLMEFEEVALLDDGPHTRIVQKFPLLDANGKINLIGGIVTDITERKRTVEFCKQCKERFRLLVEGVQDYAIFALDPEGKGGHVECRRRAHQGLQGRGNPGPALFMLL